MDFIILGGPEMIAMLKIRSIDYIISESMYEHWKLNASSPIASMSAR